MTPASYFRISVVLIMMLFFFLLPPIICSADDEACQTEKKNIYRLAKIINTKKNVLDSKKLKLAEVVIAISSGNDSDILKNKEVTLIEDCQKLNKEISYHETQKENAVKFILEKCE